MIKKIGYALFDLFHSMKKVSNPTLIMTLLVKNEGDLLEENLLFHKAMGVDGFIVTDNNSTDATMDIIKKYQSKGWIKEVIEESSTDYEQKEWVDKMVWMAKTKYHADWIINADADEFWFPPTFNLKDELKNTHANVLRCEMHNVYPEENKPFWQWDKVVNTVNDAEKYGLSVYSLFCPQKKKVMHRADGYLQISMGNHKVKMLPQISQDSTISIFHFNIRGKQHFMNKMINGGQQLEQHKGRHGGRHWRYFYKLYKEGLLEEEYLRVVGTNSYEQLREDGFITTDNRLKDYLTLLLNNNS